MSRRRRSTRAVSRPDTPREGTPRLDHLVVMRESARYDRILMLGMIQQTLQKVTHLPGALDLYSAGMDVFDHPERYGATTRKVGRSRMVMIERDGVLYLYSMGSAVQQDLPDTNAFVRELTRVVSTYRPVEVWVAAFGRLIRAAEHSGEILASLTANSRFVHCEAEIDLSTPEGKLQFQVFSMIASAERDYIVRRHTAGRVAQWRRGEWIPNAFPPGYRLVDRKLELDHDMVDAVRQMLVVMAQPGLPPSEVVAALGALGIKTAGVSRAHGSQATVADARNPSEVLETIAGWVSTYATGRYELLWPNPFPGVTDIAGVEIEEVDNRDDYPFGALRFVSEVPMPEGGWADSETLERVSARTPAVTGGGAHRIAPPLSGLFEHSDESFEYSVRAANGAYMLLRRPLVENRRFHGWTVEIGEEVERLGLVTRSEWHESIADAVTEAVKNGLPAELDATRFLAVGPLPRLDPRRARLRTAQRELDDAVTGLKRARRNARFAGDDDAAQLFVDDAKRFAADERRLRAEITAIEAGLEEPELGIRFDTNGELVAHAIAALAGVERSADRSLRDALRTVVKRESWVVEGDQLRWQLHLELPHAEGTVVLGPIVGTVAVHKVKARGGNSRYRRRMTTETLVQAGLSQTAAGCLAACPVPDLAAAVSAHLGSQTLPGADPQWVSHVGRVYADPHFAWNKHHWRLQDTVRREALAILVAGGGRMARSEILRAGLTEHQLRHLSRQTPNAPSGDPVLRRVDRGRHDPAYGLLPCPHCGGFATHSVVTPETRPGVLCPTCWRSPDPGSPVFPEWYRTTATGAPHSG